MFLRFSVILIAIATQPCGVHGWTVNSRGNNFPPLISGVAAPAAADCHAGECKLCVNVLGQTACVTATVTADNNIKLMLTASAVYIMTAVVSEPDVACIDHVPSFPTVTRLCLISSDVNLAKRHACVAGTVTYDGNTVTQSMGCFTIPHGQPQIVDQWFLHLDWLTRLSGFDCHKGKCSLCKKIEGVKGCLTATSVQGGIELKLTASIFTLVDGKITSSSPSPVCTHHVPTRKEITSLCINAKNVNIEQQSACLDISVTVSGKTTTVPVGCFKIPTTVGMFPGDKLLSSAAEQHQTVGPLIWKNPGPKTSLIVFLRGLQRRHVSTYGTGKNGK